MLHVCVGYTHLPVYILIISKKNNKKPLRAFIYKERNFCNIIL